MTKKNTIKGNIVASKEAILAILDERFPKKFGRKKGGITAKEYAKKVSISTVTARSRLMELVEDNIMYSVVCRNQDGVGGAGQRVYYLIAD